MSKGKNKRKKNNKANKPKTWALPKDAAIHFQNFVALTELRDKYLKIPFGYKKSAKAAKEAQKERTEAWDIINKVYLFDPTEPHHIKSFEEGLIYTGHYTEDQDGND